MNDNCCVCCGLVIPEGRMVCPLCEKGTEIKDQKITSINTLSDVSAMLRSWSAYDAAFMKPNHLFPMIAERMADVIDSALNDGEQIIMEC